MTDPIALFGEWLADAQKMPRDQVPEPTAFALGTVSADGQPSVRMLLLKDVDDAGFVFYTNLESRKGRELSANNKAAMTFHWAIMERQVRVEGSVTRVSDADADAYFATRARGSQIGAWASSQSRPPHGDELRARVDEFERKFAGRDVPRPPHWSGFRLAPTAIEFWTGKPNRLHERRLFLRDRNGWRTETLFP